MTLRDDVLPALGLTVTKAAAQLDVSRVALSRVLNGRADISPEMALRIEAWLGVARGGEARLWLAEQGAYDVWQPRSDSRWRRCWFNKRLLSLEEFNEQLVLEFRWIEWLDLTEPLLRARDAEKKELSPKRPIQLNPCR